jgi:hypothetical protein
MRIIKMIYSIIIFIMFLLGASCKKDPPVVPPVVQPDTTSHLINWFTDDIGDYGSILRDVAIINDTLAYAVGEIHRNDTLYNLAKWNGHEWTLQQIMFYTICGQQSRTPYPASSVFAFSGNEIWVAMYGDQIAKIENGEQTQTICLPSSIRKIWGSSSNNLFVVGDNGNIARYQNGVWTSIESGTDVHLIDVWGSPDGSIVWVAGFEDSYGTVLLRNTGNGFQKVLEITDPGMPHPPDKITHVFKSLWTDKTDTVYLGAIGRVYAAPKHILGAFAPAKENTWWDYENQTEYPPETNIIRGTAGNDIFIAGYNQFIRHWNGASWKIYNEIEGDGEWYGMAVKDNFIIAVGINFNAPGSARIARGYRIKN